MATEPQVSSGEIAATSNPATPVGTVQVFSANQVNQNLAADDTGTNPPVITLQQSQATSSTTGPIPYDNTGISSADLGTTAFVAQDPYAGISSADLGTTDFIAPKGPAPAAAPADQGPAVQSAQNSQVQPGRNKYFTNDYYLDDLEITGTFLNDLPCSATNLTFKVVEPNGMTLLFNLNNAIRDLYQQPTAAINNAYFVMAIRFYGWDEKGNLVTNVGPVPGTPGTVPNNSNAAVVKYLPFQITDFTFKNANKAVEYHIVGAATNDIAPKSSALGSVPEDLQLVGETVEQVLNGSATISGGAGSSDDSKRSTTVAPAQAKSPPTRVDNNVFNTNDDPNRNNDLGMSFGIGGLSG